MHGHDVPLGRLWFETAPVVSKGDGFLEDRGCLDGATITWRTQPRHVDGMVPLQATMRS